MTASRVVVGDKVQRIVGGGDVGTFAGEVVSVDVDEELKVVVEIELVDVTATDALVVAAQLTDELVHFGELDFFIVVVVSNGVELLDCDP